MLVCLSFGVRFICFVFRCFINEYHILIAFLIVSYLYSAVAGVIHDEQMNTMRLTDRQQFLLLQYQLHVLLLQTPSLLIILQFRRLRAGRSL